MSEKKTWGVKVTRDVEERFKELIERSGKGSGEFFEDLVHELEMQKTLDKSDDELSPAIRKHFESDIQKLNNAMNSIRSIFTGQMENLSVERDQIQRKFYKELNTVSEELKQARESRDEFQKQYLAGKRELTELTKVHELTIKEKEALTSRSEDQQQLIQDRNDKIQDLKNEINEKNKSIIDKIEELKSFEPLKEELEDSRKETEKLKNDLDRCDEQRRDDLEKQKETLLFSCEKEKHKLREEFAKEKEKLRNEVRKETEQSIREFYLEEIRRRETELKNQINELQKIKKP
jgi:DNA repair exonuclease SbcCD ATPase subunit